MVSRDCLEVLEKIKNRFRAFAGHAARSLATIRYPGFLIHGRKRTNLLKKKKPSYLR